MSSKRKKTAQRCDPYRETVLSNLDDINACIKEAERSPKSCLEGIVKATVALEETVSDPDIQCVALVRKAELLFIAHKHKYNLDGLPGDVRLYSIDKCIADCEKVLNDYSENSKEREDPVYAKARELHHQAWKLKEDLQKEEKEKSWNSRHSQQNQSMTRFNPTKTIFKSVDMINPSLLQDVVDCYRKYRIVCRVCYYKRHSKESFTSSHYQVCRGSKKYPQKLVLIPASKMCDNFGSTSEVVILPAPKLLLTSGYRHKPFQMCRNADHQFCESKAANGENRFAHSIEELVVWTIERHYECSFMDYIERHHKSVARERSWTDTSSDQYDDEDVDTDDLFSDNYSDYEDGERDNDEFEFHLERSEIIFENMAHIPRNLLLSVVECYRKMREYCKWCYYKNDEQGTASVDHQSDMKVCSLCKFQWNPVKVIPASDLCWNFGDFDLVPIAPWPAGKPKKDPFEYCKKKDHFRCFRVYVDSEFWYPHSVEEMVIWTVEREQRSSFGAYIKSLGRQQVVKHEHQSAAGQSPSSSSRNRSPALPPSNVPVEHRIGKENAPVNVEGGPSVPSRPATISNKHKVLLETPQGSARGPNTGIRGPSLNQGISGPNPVVGTDQRPSGPNLGISTSNQGIPPGPNQVISGPNQGAYNNQGVPPEPNLGSMMMRPGGPGMDLRQPMGAVTNGGLNPAQLTFPTYHMYRPGGQRAMMFTSSGMRPVMNFGPQYRPAGMGGPPQNPPQQSGPRPYGMPANSPYYTNYPAMFQGAMAAPNMMTYEMAGDPLPPLEPPGSSNSDGPVSEAQSNSNKVALSDGSSDSKPGIAVKEPVKTGSNAGDGGTASRSENKTVSGGRRNYTVVSQSDERSSAFAVDKGSTANLDGRVGSLSGSMNNDAAAGSLVVKASSGVPRLATKVMEAPSKVFRFSEMNFKDMDDIPVTLIKSVALCFKEKKLVCRMCFFGDRDLSMENAGMCSAGEHKWLKPIIVIPGSSQCDNEPSFQPGEHIPIFPLPPVAMLKKCPNKNHHKCFTKALEKQLFQAHSVEELVTWLVEGEKDCSLEAYVRELNVDSGSEASLTTSEPVSPLPWVPGVADMTGRIPSSQPPPIGSAQVISPVTSPGPMKPTKATDRASVAVNNVMPLGPPVGFSSGFTGWNPMQSAPLQVDQEELQDQKELSPARTKKYSPKDVSFVEISEIPSQLLSSIAESFKQLKLVCRVCFFMTKCSSLVSKSDKKGNSCKKDHSPWKPIRVIPKSPLCVNRIPYIAILALPKHMRKSRSPFEVCKKTDHSLCYAMSRDNNPWFPHTVEELIVWIVERETGQQFENIYKKYIVPKNRATVGTSGSKAKAGASSGSSTEPTNYSAAVTKPQIKAGGGAAVDTNFSSNMTEEDAGNSQPFDDVVPLNPPKQTMEVHMAPTNMYMHSQQILAPPPGYTMSGMPFFPSQPVAQMFQPSFYPQGFMTTTGQGLPVGMTTTGQGLPIHPIMSHSSSSNQQSSEREEAQPDQGQSDEFSATRNEKEEQNDANMLRNAIWHDENPLPESSTWSRAVGNKSDFRNLSPLHSLSQQSYESKGMDDLVHQSQVDEDAFQPYNSIKPAPIIPALVERRSGAKEPEPPKMVNYTRSPLQAGDALNSSRSTSSTKSGSDTSGSSRKLLDSSHPTSMDNGNFLASAMAVSEEEIRFSREQMGGDDGSDQEDIYHSRSNSPEDGIAAQPSYPTSNVGLFHCLLCFKQFQTSDELKSHSSSDLSHLELCLLDCGHDMVWRYGPPPPTRLEDMKVCTVPGCVGPPQCSKPHNSEQLAEWRARIKHRQQRSRTGAHLVGQASPNLTSRENCLPMSTCRAIDRVTVSEPSTVPNNGYSWTIHIQGQNWLNLFGVSITTTSSWTFKITLVEGAGNMGVFHPHASMWRAPLVRGYRFKQCLMLSSIQIVVKALPPPGAGSRRKEKEEDSRVSAEVLLDLGYKQSFFVELPAVALSSGYGTANSEKEIQPPQQKPQALGLQLEQLRFSPTDDPPSWDSDFSDELGDLNIEGEDLTLQHVPIEEWGCSLTD